MSNTIMNTPTKSKINIYKDGNFYIISLVTVMGILGGTLYNPALPIIQNFYHVTTEQASWISSIYQLPAAIISPIFGILADILGKKTILIPSLLVFAVGGAFSGLAPNFTNHLEWRLLQGIGAASLEPIQLSLIGDLYQGRKLGMVMAFNAALLGISAALFPLIGGILGEFNWRYTFLSSLVAIPLALLIIINLRLPKQHRPKKFQLKSYLKSTWKTINNRSVIGLLLAVMALFLLETLCLTYIPFLATTKFGTSGTVNGALLASIAISVVFTASQLGRLLQNISEIKLIKLAFIIFAIALLIYTIVPNFWLLLIPLFLQGFAQGIAVPCCQALLAGLSSQESRGGFMAVNTTTISWGQTLGPLAGSIAIKYWGIEAVFYTGAVISLLIFGLFNYLLTTKVFIFTAKTIHLGTPDYTQQPTPAVSFASPTIIEKPVAQLLHTQTNQTILLPENFEVITIGKPNDRTYPDINLSDLPNSGVISRVHAQIRFDGKEYYIQDMGSTNGTFINKYPLIPGIWYKLKPELNFSFGRQKTIQFIFQVS